MRQIWDVASWAAFTIASACAIAAKVDWSTMVGRITGAGLLAAALGAAFKSAPGV